MKLAGYFLEIPIYIDEDCPPGTAFLISGELADSVRRTGQLEELVGMIINIAPGPTLDSQLPIAP